jgi:hypothetical protein
MSRVVLIDRDLRGQTLDASAQPDGHAREGLVMRCQLDLNTRVIGDIRGTDFLANDGPADWSQAQTYACLWRRNTNMQGSTFPADIGYLHHEPVIEIIRQRIAELNPPARLREKLVAVRDHVVNGGSWDTSRAFWWDAVSGVDRERLAALWRRVFEGYPGLARKFAQLYKALTEGGTLWDGAARWATTLTWPDGAEVVIDATNLPALPELSRHALRRWAEAEADGQVPANKHWCFVYTVAEPLIPLTNAEPMRDGDERLGYKVEDGWLQYQKAGY